METKKGDMLNVMLVKYYDLMHNMDLTRLSQAGIPITQKDVYRQLRYLTFMDLIDTKLNINLIRF